MTKRYVLVTQQKSKYEDFYKLHYKMFDNYLDLQRHLLKYWNEPVYFVFEETNIRKDTSLKIKSKVW